MVFARVFGTFGDMATSSPVPETLRHDATDVVAFDAMGVLYSRADDVGELLVPFLRSRGCVLERHDIPDWFVSGETGTPRLSTMDRLRRELRPW